MSKKWRILSSLKDKFHLLESFERSDQLNQLGEIFISPFEGDIPDEALFDGQINSSNCMTAQKLKFNFVLELFSLEYHGPLLGKNTLFLLYFPKFSTYFISRLVNHTFTRATFEFPISVYCLEKRNLERQRVRSSLTQVAFTLNGQIGQKTQYRKPLNDISMEGLSFFVYPSECVHFSKGELIDIKFLGNKVPPALLQAKVCYLKEVKNYKEEIEYYRVGAQFTSEESKDLGGKPIELVGLA